MKRLVFIGLLLLLALTACHSPEVPPSYLGSPLLQSIDSLLQQQPDSALQCLLACQNNADDTLGDVSGNISTAFDRHYCQLLLAEALYKNDYAQANRYELMAATAYFDSLVGKISFIREALGDHTAPLPFLAARAHYINGVGHYEQDSIVKACKEYMKALETAESHFDEKELVGQKARFMALTYTRLTDLFSNLYLHEQAIYFGKMSLPYYRQQDETSWHLAWMLGEIGSHYDMMEQLDSADYYYSKAIDELADTTSLTFRDVSARKAFLSYKMLVNPNTILNRLHHIFACAESKKECLARSMTIGEVFYHEQQFDSAILYLGKVFEMTQSVGLKIESAKYLMEISRKRNDSINTDKYAMLLSSYANVGDQHGKLHSQLTILFHKFEQERLEIQHQQKTNRALARMGSIIGAMGFVFLAGFIIYHAANKKRHKHLVEQKTNTENKLKMKEMQHSAVLGKAKSTIERLQEENRLLNERKSREDKIATKPKCGKDSYEALMRETVCLNIRQMMKKADAFSSFDVKDYASLTLSQKEQEELIKAIDRHCPDFSKRLKELYPEVNTNDMQLCRLYLLDLSVLQVAILLGTDYSSIRKRTNRLKEKMGNEELHLQLKSDLFAED